MGSNVAHPQLLIWGTIVFTILLVGGITFVYSRGNARLSLIFMGLGIAVTALINYVEYLNVYLPSHFIGAYNANGTPYLEASAGWSLLWRAWPLWLLPVALSAGPLLFFSLYLSIQKRHLKRRSREQHSQSEQRLTKQNEEIERYHRRWHEADEKVKQAAIDKRAFEDKQAQLLIEIRRLQQDRTQVNHRYQAEMATLKQEAETKAQENTSLLQEKKDLEQEIERLRSELYKLLAKGQ